MCDSAESELSSRLRGPGAPLGEVFSFISALYFRGKLAYATRFANAPPAVDGAFVITACGGLITPETMVTRDFAAQPVVGSQWLSSVRCAQ